MTPSYIAAEIVIFTRTEEDMHRCLDAIAKENGPGACITIKTSDIDVDEVPETVRSFFAMVEAP